jgi:hypothetical protein
MAACATISFFWGKGRNETDSRVASARPLRALTVLQECTRCLVGLPSIIVGAGKKK